MNILIDKPTRLSLENDGSRQFPNVRKELLYDLMYNRLANDFIINKIGVSKEFTTFFEFYKYFIYPITDGILINDDHDNKEDKNNKYIFLEKGIFHFNAQEELIKPLHSTGIYHITGIFVPDRFRHVIKDKNSMFHVDIEHLETGEMVKMSPLDKSGTIFELTEVNNVLRHLINRLINPKPLSLKIKKEGLFKEKPTKIVPLPSLDPKEIDAFYKMYGIKFKTKDDVLQSLMFTEKFQEALNFFNSKTQLTPVETGYKNEKQKYISLLEKLRRRDSKSEEEFKQYYILDKMTENPQFQIVMDIKEAINSKNKKLITRLESKIEELKHLLCEHEVFIYENMKIVTEEITDLSVEIQSTDNMTTLIEQFSDRDPNSRSAVYCKHCGMLIAQQQEEIFTVIIDEEGQTDYEKSDETRLFLSTIYRIVEKYFKHSYETTYITNVVFGIYNANLGSLEDRKAEAKIETGANKNNEIIINSLTIFAILYVFVVKNYLDISIKYPTGHNIVLEQIVFCVTDFVKNLVSGSKGFERTKVVTFLFRHVFVKWAEETLKSFEKDSSIGTQEDDISIDWIEGTFLYKIAAISDALEGTNKRTTLLLKEPYTDESDLKINPMILNTKKDNKYKTSIRYVDTIKMPTLAKGDKRYVSDDVNLYFCHDLESHDIDKLGFQCKNCGMKINEMKKPLVNIKEYFLSSLVKTVCPVDGFFHSPKCKKCGYDGIITGDYLKKYEKPLLQYKNSIVVDLKKYKTKKETKKVSFSETEFEKILNKVSEELRVDKNTFLKIGFPKSVPDGYTQEDEDYMQFYALKRIVNAFVNNFQFAKMGQDVKQNIKILLTAILNKLDADPGQWKYINTIPGINIKIIDPNEEDIEEQQEDELSDDGEFIEDDEESDAEELDSDEVDDINEYE